VAATELRPGASAHGLKANAIGFVDALVIGLASTAPAYSLAAVIGIVVVIAGVQAPAVLLASFVPERRGLEAVPPAIATGRTASQQTL
jgi:hypothetical protein